MGKHRLVYVATEVRFHVHRVIRRLLIFQKDSFQKKSSDNNEDDEDDHCRPLFFQTRQHINADKAVQRSPEEHNSGGQCTHYPVK